MTVMSTRAPPRRLSLSEDPHIAEVNSLIAAMQAPAFALTPFYAAPCYYSPFVYDADDEEFTATSL
jgi:hypothetical protein